MLQVVAVDTRPGEQSGVSPGLGRRIPMSNKAAGAIAGDRRPRAWSGLSRQRFDRPWWVALQLLLQLPRGHPMNFRSGELRYAVRRIVRRPAASATAILTLAVGIGGAVAM